MNQQSNSFEERDVGSYITAQELGVNKPSAVTVETDYTPFVLALAVFVVVLNRYR